LATKQIKRLDWLGLAKAEPGFARPGGGLARRLTKRSIAGSL
jgi:hypothetical protein